MRFDLLSLREDTPEPLVAPLAECLINTLAQQEASERAALALERANLAAHRAAQASARAQALSEQAAAIRNSITSALDEAQQEFLEELRPKQLQAAF